MADADSPLGSLIDAVLTKSFYGHTVGEVMAASLLLEQMLDAVMVAAIVRRDEDAIDLAVRKVFSQLGRERKVGALPSLLAHLGAADADCRRICEGVRDVFQLRDKMAHSSMPSTTAGLAFQFRGYRGGRTQEHQVSIDNIAAILRTAERVHEDMRRLVGSQ